MILPHRQLAFVFVVPSVLELPAFLRAALTHSWVASYQVGFGPPLFKATPRLYEEAKAAPSVLDKLDVYFQHCLFDPVERTRLVAAQRQLAIRRFGPLEAETLDRSDAEALDMTLRLHVPRRAPPKAQEDMKTKGVGMNWVPDDAPPEPLTGRFIVRLSDPRNDRLLHVQAVSNLVTQGDPAALELRAPAIYPDLWSRFVEVLAEQVKVPSVMLADLAPHARVMRNGERA